LGTIKFSLNNPGVKMFKFLTASLKVIFFLFVFGVLINCSKKSDSANNAVVQTNVTEPEKAKDTPTPVYKGVFLTAKKDIQINKVTNETTILTGSNSSVLDQCSLIHGSLGVNMIIQKDSTFEVMSIEGIDEDPTSQYGSEIEYNFQKEYRELSPFEVAARIDLALGKNAASLDISTNQDLIAFVKKNYSENMDQITGHIMPPIGENNRSWIVHKNVKVKIKSTQTNKEYNVKCEIGLSNYGLTNSRVMTALNDGLFSVNQSTEL
jgi:hypothetical protein